MLHNFSYRIDRYDFWAIYEAIKKYYPIGIDKREGGNYFLYQGIKDLEKVIVENIHEESKLKERWGNRINNWSERVGHKIKSTTYGQAPSFSARIELENIEIRDRILMKEMHIAVSLIGPFYTIFGSDMTSFIERDAVWKKGMKKRDRFYTETHRTVISPYKEYAETFNMLRILIEQDFKEYRFVPHFIHSQVIHGVQVRYRDDILNRIYHALFNDFFNFEAKIVGDQDDGMEQWLVDNPNWENYWTIYPPEGKPED
jgi:hypothetical protein